MRVDESWEAKACMKSFLNSYVPFKIKLEQELHESWWELRRERLHESFLNSHVPFKLEQELHESSVMKVEKLKLVWEFSQLLCPVQN
jgi:hypothetical protein